MQLSRSWGLIQEDLRSAGRGLVIALLGALATYLADTVPGIDFGQYTLLVGAVNAFIVNLIRKFVSERVY